ncbi:L-aspartate oxidase [Priestia koreensis]|uniref:L-aspartate oxidase n=1 Tax=Priestia koreensis TaxID=284581 RepID=UPI00203ABB35|nr:L-aspartate oxidase [Priestia koreensis]MCM3002629.1 L-aspartate oxidase [Priestia koreensis]
MIAADVIIIGSGLAAFAVAEKLCLHKRVLMLSKQHHLHSNSIRAQGGVAAALFEHDHGEEHYNDTLLAGRFHNHEEHTKLLVKEGPLYIQQLINRGIQFDRGPNGQLELGREGGHRKRRIVHAGGDQTGETLMSFFSRRVLPHICLHEYEMIQDVIVEEGGCRGIVSRTRDGQLCYYYAPVVVLATGGCGALFTATTNDASVTGDGLAVAYRAGAELIDLEFMQFHPTLLRVGSRAVGLVSEAVRGEGAVLVTDEDVPFMDEVHPLGSLAPRDIVAREIDKRIKKGEHIYLSVKHVKNFSNKFPGLTNLCRRHHIPIDERIPVVPGAHFLMGGVKVNKYGETSIKGLYAVGEVACTGVHGANRLASNSLLECLVFGNLAAQHIRQNHYVFQEVDHQTTIAQSASLDLPDKETIQQWATKTLGIVRRKEELEGVIERIQPFDENIQHDQLSSYTNEDVTKINMLTVVLLMAKAALKREESRGAHYRTDFPLEHDKKWKNKRISHQRKQVSGAGSL